MINRRSIAVKLRNEGKSYGEISMELGVPKSTLSYWLKNIQLTPEICKKLSDRAKRAGAQALLKRNILQTKIAQERAQSISLISQKEIPKLNFEKLKLIGSALYLGEGGKSQNRVDFTNSNPQIIAIMMRFFREVCIVKEEKFRIQLSVYNEEMIEKSKGFWSSITGIPETNFIKTSLSVSKYSKKIRKNKLPYGTIQVRICDVKLFHTIQGWINGIVRNLNIIVPG